MLAPFLCLDVSDTIVFEELLDINNTSRDVYADWGYPSAQRKDDLKQAGWCIHIQRKGTARKPILTTQKQRNRRIATPPCPGRTRVRRTGPDGRQAGTLHGHCPDHVFFASEGSQL
jgi:IS5 family transposase